MARPTDASSETGGDPWNVPDDAVTTAIMGGLMDQVKGREPGDIDYGLNPNGPPRLRGSADLEEGAEGGGIFVSYRRQETSHVAGRLYDRLAGRFGESQVFFDVDAIEPGVDFAEKIFRAVAACKVLLAIIGPTWLTVADERGHRRLDDPNDIVRLEVEAALARSVLVIPILVEGTVMPTRQDLPESLADLARRNALPIRHESFRSDAGRLVTAIERVLPIPGTAAEPTHVYNTDALRDDVTGEIIEIGEQVDPEEDGRFGRKALAELAEPEEDLFGPE